MTDSKPPTQTAAPGGIDAHGTMGATNNRNPLNVLRERSQEPRFQQFAAQQAGMQGVMNPSRAVEAVFKVVGADSWSAFMRPEQVERFRQMLAAYGSTF